MVDNDIYSYLGLLHLGVGFRWKRGEDVRFDNQNLEEGNTWGREFKETVKPGMHRQRRTLPEYWDAMTYLDEVKLPPPLEDLPEVQLATSLIHMLNRGSLHQDAVVKLAALPLIEQSRSRLRAYGPGLNDPIDSVLPRKGPRPQPGLEHDPAVKAGIHRTIDVDMTALGVNLRQIDWRLLTVQAVLVQIHADLEIYYETGYQRVHKCAWRACGAWFCSKRMDGRGRFCSATCRVASGRAKARDHTT